MRVKPIIVGIATRLPRLAEIQSRSKGGSTRSASYCYGVWMKHLTLLCSGSGVPIPRVVLELGPGYTLGTGMCALLSGASHYYALDAVPYANVGDDLRLFNDLVAMFRSKTSLPPNGWPNIDPLLDRNRFPSNILTDSLLANSLAEERLEQIRAVFQNPNTNQGCIRVDYIAPWKDARAIAANVVDHVFSQVVLQSVEDLEKTYASIASWLKLDGTMTHQIDFSCLDLSGTWNGHWSCPEWLWRVISGKRKYLTNREPLSTHTSLMRRNALSTTSITRRERNDGIRRDQLAKRWKTISDIDLQCSEAFVQAKKSRIDIS
jgi:hypothetical protein